MKNNQGIHPTGRNEIPGKQTMDRLNRYCLNIKSDSDFLFVNSTPYGSISIDLDLNGILGLALRLVRHPEFYTSFKGKVENNRLEMTGGRVIVDGSIRTLSNYSEEIHDADNGKVLYVKLFQNDYQYELGSLPASCWDDNLKVVYLPLLKINKTSGWKVLHYHPADYFISKPFYWQSGWNDGVAQVYDHAAGGKPRWTDYGECSESN